MILISCHGGMSSKDIIESVYCTKNDDGHSFRAIFHGALPSSSQWCSLTPKVSKERWILGSPLFLLMVFKIRHG